MSEHIRDNKPKRDKWASRENCDFFSEHVVKNRDCLRKSGTDAYVNPAVWPQ